MNEYYIRNGFSELYAAKMLKMNSDTREYVSNEYRGRIHAIIMNRNTKSKTKMHIFKTRKDYYRRPEFFEDAQPQPEII